VRPGYKPDWLSIIGLILVALFGVWLLINFIKTPSEFYRLFLIGMTNGAVYGLVAIATRSSTGILELINFAHGDVFMLGRDARRVDGHVVGTRQQVGHRPVALRHPHAP
jgi:hypothetical protein